MEARPEPVEQSLNDQQQTQQQLILLVEAARKLLASPDPAVVTRTILNLAQRFIAADAYAVWRESQGVWKLEATYGLSDNYAQKVVRWDSSKITEPLHISDVTKSSPLSYRKDDFAAEGIRSILAIPLIIRGEILGTVVFYGRTPHEHTEEELRVGAALGNLAAAALEVAELYVEQTRLRQEAEAAARKTAFLARAGAVLSSSLDYGETLSSVAELAVSSFSDWVAVDLVDDSGALERVAVKHIDPAKVQFAEEFQKRYPPKGDALPAVVTQTGQSVLMEQIPEEFLIKVSSDTEQLAAIRQLELASLMVVPLKSRERTFGALTFVTAESRRCFTKADLEFAEELAARVATAVDNARLYREVRRSEERYRCVLAASTSIVWVLNASGEFASPQLSWEAYTGHTWEQYRGFGWAKAIHPDDREGVLASWARQCAARETYIVTLRIWHAQSAEYRYCTAWVVPVFDADGTLREWIGTQTDVHEARRGEEERKDLLAREQEARNTAELLKRLGMILSAELELQPLTQQVTDIATQLSGAEFGAFFHNLVSDEGEHYTLYTLSGASRESFEKYPLPRKTAVFGPTFLGEHPVRSDDITKDPRYGKNAPYRGMPEGHLPVRSYLAVPVVSRFGEVLGGLFFGHAKPGVFTEKSEELVLGLAAQAAIAFDNARLFAQSKRAQDALRRSNEELKRANEDLNQFAYSASHDLQEPLRVVSIYSQLLKKRYQKQLDETGIRYLDFAVGGAQRMEALVRDLLAYTQSAPVDDEPVVPSDANAVLQRVLMNFQTILQESAAVVIYGNLPTVAVKEVHLLQLLQNLIGNALKYRGVQPPRIVISAVPQEGSWLFSIQDNGIGIDPAYKEQIFGLFKRLHTAADYSGTGIGLAICQKIVQRYGTRIWVESEPGRGSTFFFTLPANN